MLNLTFCHNWSKQAYSEASNYKHRFNATYKDYLVYCMRHFKVLYAEFKRLSFINSLRRVLCIVNNSIDCILYCLAYCLPSVLLCLLAFTVDNTILYIISVVIIAFNIVVLIDFIKKCVHNITTNKYE